MKKIILLFIFFIFTSNIEASKKVRFTASEPDAKIYIESRLLGTGKADIVIPSYACVVVRVEKSGFLVGRVEFCNKPGHDSPPKMYLFTMELDHSEVKVTTSEPDAKIYVDGQDLGTGNLTVKIPLNECVKVQIKKPGFFKYEQTYCNQVGKTTPPTKQFFEMQKDDAYEASSKSDIANVGFDIEVKKDMSVSDSWKLISQVVTQYFDDIELNDKETSYLKTAWNIKTFAQNTIRTRLIITLAKSTPFTIKVKLVSEYSGAHSTGVKEDEKFHEWDRVLYKYKDMITDFTSRVGIK